LRLLEEQESKLKALRADLIEGENDGLAEPFYFEAFTARKAGSETAGFMTGYRLAPRAS
jgi:hypothetical protein